MFYRAFHCIQTDDEYGMSHQELFFPKIPRNCNTQIIPSTKRVFFPSYLIARLHKCAHLFIIGHVAVLRVNRSRSSSHSKVIIGGIFTPQFYFTGATIKRIWVRPVKGEYIHGGRSRKHGSRAKTQKISSPMMDLTVTGLNGVHVPAKTREKTF